MPPTLTAWPEDADFDARLGAFGGTLPAGLTSEELIAEAVSNWDHATHWSPFLAEAQASATLFDYDGRGALDLRGGYTEVTQVKANISTSYAGDVLQIGEAVQVFPSHAPNVARPYTGLVFSVGVLAGVGTIEVTGVRGYCATIPRDAWYAVLDEAVRLALVASAGVSGTVVEWQQDTVKKKYSSSQGGGTVERLQSKFDTVAARYRRVHC